MIFKLQLNMPFSNTYPLNIPPFMWNSTHSQKKSQKHLLHETFINSPNLLRVCYLLLFNPNCNFWKFSYGTFHILNEFHLAQCFLILLIGSWLKEGRVPTISIFHNTSNFLVVQWMFIEQINEFTNTYMWHLNILFWYFNPL